MHLKTFTALITIAVNDGESMPNEFDMGVRLMNSLEGKHSPTAPMAQAAHVSVLQGDVMMEPHLSVRTTQKHGLMKLNALGHSLQMVKDQHGLLHRRSTEQSSIPHPSLNEGSDID